MSEVEDNSILKNKTKKKKQRKYIETPPSSNCSEEEKKIIFEKETNLKDEYDDKNAEFLKENLIQVNTKNNFENINENEILKEKREIYSKFGGDKDNNSVTPSDSECVNKDNTIEINEKKILINSSNDNQKEELKKIDNNEEKNEDKDNSDKYENDENKSNRSNIVKLIENKESNIMTENILNENSFFKSKPMKFR